MSKIVIVGASGFIATSARKFFLQNNHSVISISRRNFRKIKNEIKIISEDYSEKDIITKIKNSDVLFHLVGIGKQTVENDYQTINYEFTKKIINICKSAKIKHIVYLSGLGVSKNTPLGYFISKYKSERAIINSGLNYTIFRPSFVVGKNDYLTKNLKNQAKQNKLFIPGSGKFKFQPISINDVVRVFDKTLNNNKFRNKVLDLVGPKIITYEKYVELFSQITKTSFQKLNLETAYYKAISNPNPPFELDDLNLLVGNFIGNHKKLQKITNLKFSQPNEILESSSLS